MPQTKILLDESDIPTHWYNVVADMPNKPAPPLGPDGKPVGEPRTVLREDCHLSYPQVFSHQGRWYLLPESCARSNLVLYEADALPGPWRPAAELLSGVRVADATLWQEDDGSWALLACRGADQGPLYDTLVEYRSAQLLGPWQAAGPAPVRVDGATARPAGPRFRWRGRWLRPVQDCRVRYGWGAHLLETNLRADNRVMDERLVASLSPRPGSALQCVHSYSRQGSFLAVDWLRWCRKGRASSLGAGADIVFTQASGA